MHPLKTSLVTALVTLFAAASAFSDDAGQLLSEAQAAYLRGDMENAKRNFEIVNRLDPRNKTAIGYLRMIKAQEAKKGGSGGSEQEKQLQALIVPQVQFRDATLGSALEYLRQQATKISGGKTSVNFVIQLPDEVVKSQAVTLSLTNVPFSEVLRYLGDLAGISFTYEKYAIAVRPKEPKTASAAGAAGQ